MREIKFRAWDKDEKEMIKWDILKHTDIDNWANNSFIPIMQYTGLKDKNGKEIYEGDIVKMIKFQEWEKNLEVSFYNGAFVLTEENKNYEVLMVYSGNYLVEVIGNIYENPELLKERS